jgi:hypothetical protein
LDGHDAAPGRMPVFNPFCANGASADEFGLRGSMSR